MRGEHYDAWIRDRLDRKDLNQFSNFTDYCASCSHFIVDNVDNKCRCSVHDIDEPQYITLRTGKCDKWIKWKKKGR